MKHSNQRLAPAAEAHFARRLVGHLSQAADAVPHDISERLRVARLQALSQRPRWQFNAAPAVLSAGGGSATLASGGPGRFGPWRFLGSLLPLLALVIGLVGLNLFLNEERAHELAEFDAALLTDDLPPAAYADPGFAQFLKSAPRESSSSQ